MDTDRQIEYLRRAVRGVGSANPAARKTMTRAVLAKGVILSQERDRIAAYLDKGWTWFATHPEEGEKWGRWQDALRSYQEICDALEEAEKVIGAREGL